jgi:SPP1 gp7 family putative phage head morphogenesis protein
MARAGIFTRNREPDFQAAVEKAALAVVEALIEKSPSSMLAGASRVSALQPGAMAGQPEMVSRLAAWMGANQMPRGGVGFEASMGPAVPLSPTPLDPVDEDGNAVPRLYEYQVAQNLQLRERHAQWGLLRRMVDHVDLVHRCTGLAIDTMLARNWSWTLSEHVIGEIMIDQQCSKAKAAQIGRDLYGPEIDRMKSAWENPYPEAFKTFEEWFTELMWQHYTFDAVAIYPARNRGGEVIGLEVIDAATIKVLLNGRGGTPRPPAPAFQQVIWGWVRGDYQASPNSAGEFYSEPGFANEFATAQLAYFRKTKRTWSPYGFGPTEESIPWAAVYLERQQWIKKEFTAGTLPRVLFQTDMVENLTPLQLSAFNRQLNDYLAGDTSARAGGSTLPGGFKPDYPPQFAEKFNTEFDEYLLKRISNPWGITPTQLGVIPRTGLGGRGQQQGEQDSADMFTQQPTENYFVGLLTALARRFYGCGREVTATCEGGDTEEDTLQQAQARQTALFSGFVTLNDIVSEDGRALYEQEEADTPFIVVPGSGIQFLTGLVDQQRATQAAQQATFDTAAKGPTSDPTQAPQEAPPVVHVQGGARQEAHTPPAHEQAGPSPRNGASHASKAEVAERRRFETFVKVRRNKGEWRDFRFEHVPDDQASVLNKAARADVEGTPDPTARAARPRPKGHHRIDQIEAQYQQSFRDAMRASVRNVDSAIHAGIRAGTDKADTPDAEAIREAVAGTLRISPKQLIDLIKRVYGDSYLVGARAAIEQVGTGASVAGGISGLAAGMNWDSWVPGNADAANAVADGGLLDLLSAADVTIKGITDTTVDLIGNAIADGVGSGATWHEMSTAIAQITGDTSRADLIAVTESNRAYVSGSIDQYAQAGVEQFDWIAYDDACEDCEDEESGNPHDLTDDAPPEHPNCRCTVAAVIAGTEQPTGD